MWPDARSLRAVENVVKTMSTFGLGLVGCSGMGLRHVFGLSELTSCLPHLVTLVAVCDRHLEAANYVADQAERHLGRRPRVFGDYHDMLKLEPALDAIAVVTDPPTHHELAVEALTVGKAVALEKPMGATVRACRRILETAEYTGKHVSVFENYRRDPIHRLVAALLDYGILGERRMLQWSTFGGGRRNVQLAAWRHQRLAGGCLLEFGIHRGHLTQYFFGSIERVAAFGSLFEPERHNLITTTDKYALHYGHRVIESSERRPVITATAEDTAFSILEFTNGALGQLSFSWAAHGRSFERTICFGSEGQLEVPPSRTGKSPALFLAQRTKEITGSELLNLIPSFELDELTAKFIGESRIAEYSFSFDEIDRKLIAIEYGDFFLALQENRNSEVTGYHGLNDVALIYASLESMATKRPVRVAEVADGTVSEYQREVDRQLGLIR